MKPNAFEWTCPGVDRPSKVVMWNEGTGGLGISVRAPLSDNAEATPDGFHMLANQATVRLPADQLMTLITALIDMMPSPASLLVFSDRESQIRFEQVHVMAAGGEREDPAQLSLEMAEAVGQITRTEAGLTLDGRLMQQPLMHGNTQCRVVGLFEDAFGLRWALIGHPDPQGTGMLTQRIPYETAHSEVILFAMSAILAAHDKDPDLPDN